jgi:hypothetical protein
MFCTVGIESRAMPTTISIFAWAPRAGTAGSRAGVVGGPDQRALSAAPPLTVRLSVSDLKVITQPADDETLAQARSRVFALTDSRLREKEFIAALYD